MTTGTLTATVKDASDNPIADSPVSWTQTAGAENITIASDGSYIVHKAGTFTVTATADDDPAKFVTQSYTIAATPAEVSFSGITSQVSQGATGTLTATVKDKNGVDITATTTIQWELSSPGIITLTNPGSASTGWSATAIGDVTITLNATAGGISNRTQSIAVAVGKVPTAVRITNAPATTNDTATGTFAYNITYSDGSHSETSPVTWSASPAGILTIDPSGNWIAQKAGTVDVTVAVSGRLDINATSAIRVNATPASASFTGIQSDVTQFTNGTLTATVLDKEGNDITASAILVWSAEPVGNITFTYQSGSTVTWNATNVGNAVVKLTATAEGVTKENTTSVTVTKSVRSLELRNGPAASTNDTASGTFGVTITYSDGSTSADITKVTWTSSDSTVLSVDVNGNWNAEKAGTASITGTVTGTGVTDTTGAVTIAATPASITLSGITGSLLQDNTGTAAAEVRDKHGTVIATPVTWSSNNTSVITIGTTDGRWTAVAKGTANITATAAAGGVTKQQNLTVSVVNIPRTVEITNIPADLRPAGTADLIATVYDDDRTVITPDTLQWTSADTGIFTIDSSTGRITAVAAGTADVRISASFRGITVTNATPVTVKPNAGITIDQPADGSSHKAGTPVQFNATPVGLDPITGYLWTFGDGQTAAVQNTTHTYDEITGIGPRTINLTVTYDGGQTVSKEIALTLIKNDSRAADLRITAAPDYIYTGKTGTFAATVTDQYGDPMTPAPAITWTINPGHLMTITGSSWTSDAAGTGIITATVTGTAITNTSSVQIIAESVPGSVVLNGAPAKMSIGSSTSLTAFVLNQRSEVIPDAAVTWTTNDSSIMTVTDGTITALAAGFAKITAASTADPSIKTEVDIEVIPSPAPVLNSIQITGAPGTLFPGDTASLGIIALDQNNAAYTPAPAVTWTSSDPAVTVDSTGKITAVSVGSATITADAGGKTNQIIITVSSTPRPATQTLTTVTVTPVTLTLHPGKTVPLAAVAADENGNLFTNETLSWTWSSSDTSVTVDSTTGEITAVSVGSATITAEAATPGGATQRNTAAITVVAAPSGPDPVIDTVLITPAALTVLDGTRGTLRAVVLNRDNILLPGETVTWTSSDPAAVTIDSSTGTYRALSVSRGTTITATSVGDSTKTATITITVIRNPDKKVPTGITLTAPSELAPGQTATASATVLDQYGQTMPGETVTWTSSSPGVADISTGGRITAITAGTTTITAKVFGYDSITADQQLTVTGGGTPVPTPRPPTPSGSGSDSSDSSTITAVVDGIGKADFTTSLGITGISFAKGTTGIAILDLRPAGITAPGNSYGVYDITAPAFEGYAQIEFSVPVSLLTDNGYTGPDVVLQHYTGGKWIKLQTTYLGETRGAANYVTLTRTFSPFAIVYERGGADTIGKATPNPTAAQTGDKPTAGPTAQDPSGDPQTGATAEPTPVLTTGDSTARPTLTQAPAPLCGALAGLLIAGLLLRRKD